MKDLAKLFISISACLAIMMSLGCGGGGGGGGTTPTQPTGVSVNTLDGSTDVPVGSTFVYTFVQAVNASSVTASSYFIVPTPTAGGGVVVKAEIDQGVCDSTNALDATVACPTSTACTLDPTNDLDYGTGYSICLTTDISYDNGTAFEGFMAQFTTVSEEVSGEAVSITDAKLVRLDGTELNFDATPIPKKVSIKFTLSAALTDETDRQAFEGAVTLEDDTQATVAGSFSWAGDYTYAMFTPTRNLEYRTEYTVVVNESSLPTVDLSTNITPAVDLSSLFFTTMTWRDINGDGYADVIVGTHETTNGNAYIFYGSASGISDYDLSSTPADATFTGTSAGDYLGYSVAIAGDVNADGYEDVIIGASWVGTKGGEAYIFHGGSTALSGNLTPSSADATISHEEDSDELGYSVSTAGDVNGDGYDDIIIGARIGGTAPDNTGQAYVFHGSATGISDCDLSGTSCTPDTTITGEATPDNLGFSVSTAGDVNGDGYDDVIAGAQQAATNFRGKAYIFYGSTNGISDFDLSSQSANSTITGKQDNDYLGWSVSTAGDVNGDGYDDVIIGAEQGGTVSGEAYILHGSASGIPNCNLSSCTPPTTITGDGLLGSSVSTAGDLNGDGYSDVIMGAYNLNTGRGRVYIFDGSANGIGDCDITGSCTNFASISGAVPGDQVGKSVSVAGDINGDGYDDIIIGSPLANGAGTNRGEVHVFTSTQNGITDCDLSGVCTDLDATFTGAADEDRLGNVR